MRGGASELNAEGGCVSVGQIDQCAVVGDQRDGERDVGPIRVSYREVCQCGCGAHSHALGAGGQAHDDWGVVHCGDVDGGATRGDKPATCALVAIVHIAEPPLQRNVGRGRIAAVGIRNAAKYFVDQCLGSGGTVILQEDN